MMPLYKRSPKKSPEHGDWRVPLTRPEETEHLPPHPLTVWKKLRLRAEYLQTMPVGDAALRNFDSSETDVVPLAGATRYLRLALAWLVLLPLSVLMVYALLLHLYGASSTVGLKSFWMSVPVWYTLLGAGAFCSLVISRIAMPVLVYVYVLGHELTHALAAKLCLGKVQAFKIDLNGGYVETDADNLFIALSPYFIPLWMCVWLMVLWLVKFVYPFEEWEAWFYAGFGFWWSFHLYWTAWVIPREQPDMLENGVLFSLLLIMIMNIGILLVVLYAFGVLSPSGYMENFLQAAQQMYDSASDLYVWLTNTAVNL